MSTQPNYDKDCIIIKETVTKEEFELVINEINNQIKLLKEENIELRNLIKNNNIESKSNIIESKSNKPEIKAPENVQEILNRIRAENLVNTDSEYSSSDEESKNKSIDEKQEILNRFRDQIKANNSFIASNYLN
jgi:hypothetical protein